MTMPQTNQPGPHPAVGLIPTRGEDFLLPKLPGESGGISSNMGGKLILGTCPWHVWDALQWSEALGQGHQHTRTEVTRSASSCTWQSQLQNCWGLGDSQAPRGPSPGGASPPAQEAEGREASTRISMETRERWGRL